MSNRNIDISIVIITFHNFFSLSLSIDSRMLLIGCYRTVGLSEISLRYEWVKFELYN